MKLAQRVLVLFFLAASVAQAQQVPENYKNPIIPGFHPDPSICRVGDDYYLVNSSFEWYPGLPIYHSKDLVNWKLIGYGMHRPKQVELPVGLNDSRGIYAPTIRYHDGLFYIITTCVNCKDNFYITAKDPAGPWSDPVWLGSRGIDPSLFWDDDGRCYYQGHANITNINDWPQKNGAWMQELDLEQQKLIGERKQLTHGHAKNARWTEGPHLYKIDGKYLLMVAEGGTGFHHSVTVHFSDSLWGPYIPAHTNPVLTHRHLGKDYPIHSVGHADIVKTQNDEWWMVCLAKRTYDNSTLLARETFLVPFEFQNEEGNPLPVVNPGIGKLLDEQKRPNLPWTPVAALPERDNFDSGELRLEYNFLRTPYTQWYSLADGQLKINLRPEVADSMVNPSLIVKRIQDHHFSAATSMTFKSKKANEHAGLILYRKSGNHLQLIKEKNQLVLIQTLKGIRTEMARVDYSNPSVVLSVNADGSKAVFSYGPDPEHLTQIGEAQNMGVLSDEKAGGFSGPYIGMYASSNNQASKTSASFDWFEYIGTDRK